MYIYKAYLNSSI